MLINLPLYPFAIDLSTTGAAIETMQARLRVQIGREGTTSQISHMSGNNIRGSFIFKTAVITSSEVKGENARVLYIAYLPSAHLQLSIPLPASHKSKRLLPPPLCYIVCRVYLQVAPNMQALCSVTAKCALRNVTCCTSPCTALTAGNTATAKEALTTTSTDDVEQGNGPLSDQRPLHNRGKAEKASATLDESSSSAYDHVNTQVNKSQAAEDNAASKSRLDGSCESSRMTALFLGLF
ncbi:hypothetical protein K431DRAFT_293803 [Polychaeton citri CBS 116435]|uniref:Uncharacterized protein n=1 Tax=Polychaeton citri CBS 116435 TaxID=1314669 RepID=A0A9P4UPK7_9PEZI|nr:hypothetical protein K431DRAFT_293803 [Polychaeton citri CBS 116435]